MKNTALLFLITLVSVSCSSSKQKSTFGFTKNEIRLIMSSDSATPMRVYKITNKKDSILLRTKSTYIKPDPNDKRLTTLVNKLYITVRDSISMGVGIAAPQVGVLKNIIWVQRFDKDDFPFEVYLNPIITNYSSKKQVFREGCLSIPNRADTIKTRAYQIILEYDTMKAEHKTDTIEGFTSVIFQHEIDHLNGILYLDHLNKDLQEETINN